MLDLYNRTVGSLVSDYRKKSYYSPLKPEITLKDKFFMGVLLLLACLFTMNIVVYAQTI